jgi:hypothetical protein
MGNAIGTSALKASLVDPTNEKLARAAFDSFDEDKNALLAKEELKTLKIRLKAAEVEAETLEALEGLIEVSQGVLLFEDFLRFLSIFAKAEKGNDNISKFSHINKDVLHLIAAQLSEEDRACCCLVNSWWRHCCTDPLVWTKQSYEAFVKNRLRTAEKIKEHVVGFRYENSLDRFKTVRGQYKGSAYLDHPDGEERAFTFVADFKFGWRSQLSIHEKANCIYR